MKWLVVLTGLLVTCASTSTAMPPPQPQAQSLFAVPPMEHKGHKLQMCLQDYTKPEQTCLLRRDNPPSCMIMIDQPSNPNWQVGLIDCQTGELMPPPREL